MRASILYFLNLSCKSNGSTKTDRISNTHSLGSVCRHVQPQKPCEYPKRVVQPRSVCLSQRLDSNSLSMSMFRNITSLDARRATFNNVGGDQINSDQINFNISHINNQTGAMQCYPCVFTVHTQGKGQIFRKDKRVYFRASRAAG
jgi:hypothetical protein